MGSRFTRSWRAAIRHAPIEFDIPTEAIRGGELVLTWEIEHGRGGNPGGAGVCEVWLIKHVR